ncbi:MAG: hypothetical protein Q9224_006235 [Gallowayella concinna]
MSFAPPIARDGFYYNGDLYVEVGNLNRHKRASVPEITDILRPDLNQSKHHSAALPSKDPVGHWYEAQLIHYGLPPSKDKSRAKMRLLEALNTSKLHVPAPISQLEAQMKKEYAAAEKKAKAQHKADMASAGQKGPTASSKKRKQPEPSHTVNVNINFGGFSGNPHQVSTMMGTNSGMIEPPVKKAKTAATTTAKSAATITKKGASAKIGDGKAAKERAQPNKTSTEKGTTRKDPAPARTEKVVSGNGPTLARPKQTARRTIAVKKEPVMKKEPAVKKEPTIKKESTGNKGAAIKKDTSVKQEPKVKKESTTSSQPKLGLINGYYDISCPDLEGQFQYFDDPLSLILCLDSPGVWGAYDFGMFSGILHLENRPWEPSDEPIPCTWRGRENSEGQMRFGPGCRGEITFLGDGRIEGWLNVYGQSRFQGQRSPGPLTAPRSAASMRDEWDGYNEENYEYERVNRW